MSASEFRRLDLKTFNSKIFTIFILQPIKFRVLQTAPNVILGCDKCPAHFTKKKKLELKPWKHDILSLSTYCTCIVKKWTEKSGWQRIYCLPTRAQRRGMWSLCTVADLDFIHCIRGRKAAWAINQIGRAMKNPPRAYNDNSLSADTRAAAVIFASPHWGNIDICKSTEGIRQGSLPPAVQGQWHAGSNRELCASLFRMERIWRGRRIIPIVDKQSHQRESRCGAGGVNSDSEDLQGNSSRRRGSRANDVLLLIKRRDWHKYRSLI